MKVKVDIQLKGTKLIEIETDVFTDLVQDWSGHPYLEKTSYVDFEFENGATFSSKFSGIDILELFAWFYDYNMSANTPRELCLSWMQYHFGQFETNGNTIIGCWFNDADGNHIEYEYHYNDRHLDTSRVYEKETPQ
jgi:hypothetical protein